MVKICPEVILSLKRIEMLDTLTPAMVEEFSKVPRTTTEIELLIDSDGGLSRRCKAIVAAIRQLKGYGVTTTAVVIGKAQSAAFTILQECDTRKATFRADLMFHAPGTLRLGREGEPFTVDDRNPEHPMHIELLDVLSTRTGLPVATLKEWADQERHFNADEALRYRFIDEIVNSSRYEK